MNRAVKVLLEEVGPEAALTRLAGIPSPLPASLIKEALALDNEAVTNVSRECLTPISRIALFRVAVAGASSDPTRIRWAQELSNALLDPKKGRQAFENFHEILRWTFESLRLNAATTNWHASVFLAVAWTHATRLHNILLKVGIDPAVISRNFAHALSNLPRPVYTERANILDDATNYLNVRWPLVLIRGMGSSIAMAPDSIASHLQVDKELLLHSLGASDEELVPVLILSEETSTRPNVLNSFFGGEWEPPLRAVLGDGIFTEWFDKSPEQKILSQIEILEKDHFDVSAWVILRQLIGSSPFPAVAQRRAHILMENVDFLPLFRREPVKAAVALSFACSQARNLKDSSLSSKFEEQMISCAHECKHAIDHKQGPLAETETLQTVINQLVDASYWLGAIGSSDESSFASVSIRLIKACPEIGSALSQLFGRRADCVPLRFAAGAWPFYLAIRAAP